MSKYKRAYVQRLKRAGFLPHMLGAVLAWLSL